MATKGCHLVGSVPFSSAEEVFKTCLQQMPGRLKRIPDGETGQRKMFTMWQWLVLQEQAPILSAKFEHNSLITHKTYSPDEVEAEINRLRTVGYKTRWDEPTLAGYASFKRMKEAGEIPQDVKFQVCLPAPSNVIAPFVEGAFQAAFEPIYEEAYWKDLRRIQDEIPHDQFSIQIDLAVDTAFWMGVYLPWWGEGDVKVGVIEYLTRMINQIDEDVELGFHNCYGDMEHRHWYEPTDLSAPVERLERLYPHISHRIAFFHVPVPLSAMDSLDTFLAPLKRLVPRFQADGTDLYLGLVHADDLEGTYTRIEAAKRVLGEGCEFGVATECGWGRTPEDHFDSIMAISKEVSGRVLGGDDGEAATTNGHGTSAFAPVDEGLQAKDGISFDSADRRAMGVA